MIRSVKMNIDFATTAKKFHLDYIMNEYVHTVNTYIQYYKSYYSINKNLPKFSSYSVDATWLSARMKQCCGKQALEIIRSCIKKNSNIRYKRYKKVYKYFIKRGRQISFTDKKWSELNLNHRWLINPILKQQCMNLDSRFIELQQGNNTFDTWFKMTSIGKKLKLQLPSRKHVHFNKYIQDGWTLKKSCRLYKTQGNKYYIDVFFEKEQKKPCGNNKIGIDLGINTLLSCTDMDLNQYQYGKQMTQYINRVTRKKQGSNRHGKSIVELKNYIRQEMNKLELDNVNELVLEDLTNITKNTKVNGKLNKVTRKLLSKWNLGIIKLKFENMCEISRTKITRINPRNTSRTCPTCNNVSEHNRASEKFECTKCGYSGNADIIASRIILKHLVDTL